MISKLVIFLFLLFYISPSYSQQSNYEEFQDAYIEQQDIENIAFEFTHDLCYLYNKLSLNDPSLSEEELYNNYKLQTFQDPPNLAKSISAWNIVFVKSTLAAIQNHKANTKENRYAIDVSGTAKRQSGSSLSDYIYPDFITYLLDSDGYNLATNECFQSNETNIKTFTQVLKFSSGGGGLLGWAVVFSAGGKIFQFAVRQVFLPIFRLSQTQLLQHLPKTYKWLEKNGLTSLKLMGVVGLAWYAGYAENIRMSEVATFNGLNGLTSFDQMVESTLSLTRKARFLKIKRTLVFFSSWQKMDRETQNLQAIKLNELLEELTPLKEFINTELNLLDQKKSLTKNDLNLKSQLEMALNLITLHKELTKNI